MPSDTKHSKSTVGTTASTTVNNTRHGGPVRYNRAGHLVQGSGRSSTYQHVGDSSFATEGSVITTPRQAHLPAANRPERSSISLASTTSGGGGERFYDALETQETSIEGRSDGPPPTYAQVVGPTATVAPLALDLEAGGGDLELPQVLLAT
nr:uncharacterized protein CI109_000488 [Kwoniella shandongensis]KAA5530917.1 hypothetical protein CI109_000488 [Kwoniella shandongensis]